MSAVFSWGQRHQYSFLALCTCLGGLLGGVLYLLNALLTGQAALQDQLICAVGYSAYLLGFLPALVWLYRHD